MDNVKIKKIEIINFKGIEYLELDFTYENSDRILDNIVFYGINGAGKSTVLEALYLSLLITNLSPSEKNIKDVEKTLIKMFSLGDNWIFYEKNQFKLNLELLVENRLINTQLIYDRSQGLQWSLKKGGVTFTEEFIFDYLSSYRIFTPKKIENAGDWEQVENLKSEAFEASHKEGHALSIQFYNDYNTTKQYLVNLVTDKKIDVISEKNNKILEKIKEAFIMFFPNKIFLEKLARTEDLQDYRFLIQNEDKTVVDIDQLSSGEREVIAFFTYLATETMNKQILIIDEPELHLHAKWQSILVYAIHKLFPNTQLFLATHSNEIHQSVSESELFELVK